MAIEIERKFLVNKDVWSADIADSKEEIIQGYLHTDAEKTIRVRTMGNKAYLTIKGKTIGIQRSEFEYEIPFEDARQLLEGICEKLIYKERHYLTFKGKLWEVDIFKKHNEGLILAEIELADSEELFEIPEWVGEEVSLDFRYSNSNLAKNPFNNWNSLL